MKYVYPAIFTREDAGYSVNFPDLENCFTSGETLSEAMEMAADVLNFMLCSKEDEHAQIRTASDMEDIKTGAGEFATLIAADTTEYRKLHGSQAVKKTLSIPAWLNTMAEGAGVNFSAILQKALKAELGI